jgi:hypothetical protein
MRISVRERDIAGVATPDEPDIVELGLIGFWNEVMGASRFCAASTLSFSGVWKLPLFGVFTVVPLTLPVDGCDALGMNRETSSSWSGSVVLSPMFDLDDRIEGTGEGWALLPSSPALVILT